MLLATRCGFAYAAAAARGRRQEFGVDGIADRCLENAIDLRLGRCVKLPATYLADWLQLAGVACTPSAVVNRQMDHVLAVVEPGHGGEILRETRLLKFRIGAAKIIAIEFAVRPHAPGQETAAEGAIAQGRDLVLLAIGEKGGLDAPLEQIVGRLQHVQRRDAAEPLHLLNGKFLTPIARILPCSNRVCIAS